MQKRKGTKAPFLNSLQDKLQSSKFRWLNEKLYLSRGIESLDYFQSNKELFLQYHKGFSQQVELWPVNPLDLIIDELSQIILKRPKLLAPIVIADLGCGEGRLGTTLSELGADVHSFDLVANKPHIIVTDLATLPLQSNTVDVAVFCLSLMGTDWPEFISESVRIVRESGFIYVAEVVSRFASGTKPFIEEINSIGLELVSKNEKNSHFIIFKFIKKATSQKKKEYRLHSDILKPCVYKKR